ncbi:TetR/AcrR family transcriptional regulator [Sulfurimonas sp.]|uniref:TetR/AcrR family transcriptional regulator n=1 Tax=Sulfurimonas sp. TaxID=2022749 RepID=UPI003D0EB88F
MKTKNIDKFNKLTQREKKYIKTKVTLLNVFLKELETNSLSAIMIKDIASKAEVSEPTFFNYFDSKQDLLVYFIQIWSIEMNVISKKYENVSISSLDTIKDIFLYTAKNMLKNPQLMLEIISFQAQSKISKVHQITNGEKWYFFQDIEYVEELDTFGLESIIPPLIQKAINARELPKGTDTELLFLTLSSLFFGTSLILLKKDPNMLVKMFEKEIINVFDIFSDQKSLL